MPNTYFQFKEFIIHQEYSGMKVCTDSCIFGALVEVENKLRVLDIGTGTGLLALMLAQRSGKSCKIEALEIEENAFQEALLNINLSPWADKIEVYHRSLQEYSLVSNKKYDLILCNPPFFSNHLKSSNTRKNKALHDEHLSIEELFCGVDRLLDEEGVFYLLYPQYQAGLAAGEGLKRKLYLQQERSIYNRVGGDVFRKIQAYTRESPLIIQESSLVIKEGLQYTEEFKTLLKPYYLIF